LLNGPALFSTGGPEGGECPFFSPFPPLFSPLSPLSSRRPVARLCFFMLASSFGECFDFPFFALPFPPPPFPFDSAWFLLGPFRSLSFPPSGPLFSASLFFSNPLHNHYTQQKYKHPIKNEHAKIKKKKKPTQIKHIAPHTTQKKRTPIKHRNNKQNKKVKYNPKTRG